MPALVNYSGDDDFYAGCTFYANPMDLLRSCSIGSHVDVYCPPRKRARISSSFCCSEDDQDQQPSLDSLPDECLFEIFRRVSGGKERSSCAGVSKRWLMLLSSISHGEIFKVAEPTKLDEDVEMTSSCDDGLLTRSLEGKKATDVRLAAIAVGTGGHGGLGKLSIRGSNSVRGVTDLGLSAIARGCPSLKALSLWSIPTVGDDGLFEIASGCQLLEKIDLCNCPLISNKGLIAIAENCPKLTALNIESCPQIGNEGLQAIAKFCPKLQSIYIKSCPLVGDHGISSVFSVSSSVLTKVKLQALNVTDFSLAVIGHYGRNVSTLNLSGLQNVSERGFWAMGSAQGLQKLTSLSITSCRGVTDLSLESLGKCCSNLKQMILHKCCFVSDNGIGAFAKAAGSLESLHLEECNRVTQSGIINALSNSGAKLKSLTLVKCMGIKDMDLGMPTTSPCRSLRSLSIRNCSGFGSSSLAMVGKMCPQLQHVDLSGLYGITDAGLLPFLESCEAGLAKLNLSGCFNLTDEVISALASQHGETLQLLNLDGCRKITDASLVSISENCSLLNDLDVSRCSITDFGIRALSSADQLYLQVLSLSGCHGVSNKSMPFLMEIGKTLVGLNLQHCNSISSSIVEMLISSLWRCDILS